MVVPCRPCATTQPNLPAGGHSTAPADAPAAPLPPFHRLCLAGGDKGRQRRGSSPTRRPVRLPTRPPAIPSSGCPNGFVPGWRPAAAPAGVDKSKHKGRPDGGGGGSTRPRLDTPTVAALTQSPCAAAETGGWHGSRRPAAGSGPDAATEWRGVAGGRRAGPPRRIRWGLRGW